MSHIKYVVYFIYGFWVVILNRLEFWNSLVDSDTVSTTIDFYFPPSHS